MEARLWTPGRDTALGYQLTEVQKLNVLVDSMAKKALMKAIVNREFINTAYPFEEIVLTCGGRKSVGAMAANISQ